MTASDDDKSSEAFFILSENFRRILPKENERMDGFMKKLFSLLLALALTLSLTAAAAAEEKTYTIGIAQFA